MPEKLLFIRVQSVFHPWLDSSFVPFCVFRGYSFFVCG